MRKIAFIIKLFQNKSFHGGGEKLFYKLINQLIANNYMIDIYCSKAEIPEHQGINKIIEINRPYDHTDPESMEKFYEEAQKLANLENYDFIISENITPPVDITFLQGHSLVNRLRKLKNPLESLLYNFRPVKLKQIKYQEKWLKQGYRKIFAVSNTLKNDIIFNFNIPENNISVIYPGVDIPENIETTQINTVFDSNRSFIFGLTAPGFKIKGGYVFLKALKKLKNKGFNYKARIIYPKYMKNLWVKLLIKLYGIEKDVEFLSYQENIQDFYSSIDCLVVPSLEDTFNLAALEAMASKKPCIISNFTGVSEIIDDGINGFCFEMKKNPAKNLAEKMVYLMNNLENYDKLSQNAFKTAKKYSWNKTCSDFLSELEILSK